MSSATSNSYGQTRRNRNHGLGWVPWAALLLLGAIILASYLLTRNVTDDGDQAGVDLTNDPSGQVATASASGAGNGNAAGGNAAATSGRDGIFTTSGTDVLGAGSSTASLFGQQASANNVTVRSVVADEGFWVSAGSSDQLFVFLSQQARNGGGESAPQVRAGQRVDVSGTLARVPADVGDLGVSGSEGATQLRNQGIFLDATTYGIR